MKKTDSVIPPVKKEEKQVTRADGWKNAISGMGTYVDKRSHTKWTSTSAQLSTYELADMYASDGLVQRIVNAFPDDMTREWVRIPEDEREDSDDEGFIEKELRVLGSQKAFNTALRWARLMGGSLIFIGAMDGNPPDQPLNINKVKKVEFLRVFDLNEIDTSMSEFETNPAKPEYGKIIRFQITPKRTFGNDVGKSQKLHYSRCLPFHGLEIPYSTSSATKESRYWGVSAIIPVLDYVRDFMGAMGATSQILYEFIIGKYKMADLDEMLAQGGESLLQTRMQVIDMTKSIIKAVLLGPDEEYTRDSASLSGIPDTLDRFMMMLSAVTEIPVTRLFGRSPAGLNATGENDIQNYYDVVHSKQQNDLTPIVSQLIEVIASANGKEAPAFVWNPLQQLSEKEVRDNGRLEAEKERTLADSDQRYLSEGVVSPEDIYKLRFEERLGPKDFDEMPDLEMAPVNNPLVPGQEVDVPDEEEEDEEEEDEEEDEEKEEKVPVKEKKK
jgi:uncharacterized protein